MRGNCFIPLSIFNIQLIFQMVIHDYTGWPTKISLFFFGDNFYKNKETFKIFSPQILKVYRILLVETTLESIMFYYTFSVINIMFVPCTALLHDSIAATRTLKLSTTLLSISFGIRLNFFWWCPLLSVDCFHKLCLSENSQAGWDLGNRWLGFNSLARNESVPCEDMPEVFKSSVREVRGHLISWTEHLNTAGITSNGTDSFRIKSITPSHPISKISIRQFSEGVPEREILWKQSTDKRGHHQKRSQTDSTRNTQ